MFVGTYHNAEKTNECNLLILKIPPQQASTPTCETKRETQLPLGTKHMVDGNDAIRP